MATHVIEGPQRIVLLPEDQYALAGHVHVQTVAARRQLFGSPCTKPLRMEQALALQCEHALARVEARRERRLELARQDTLFAGIHLNPCPEPLRTLHSSRTKGNQTGLEGVWIRAS